MTDADKKYIASEFVRALYQIDPATRSKDIERAIRMMLPDSALKFARYLKQDNILDSNSKKAGKAPGPPKTSPSIPKTATPSGY